MKKVVLKFRVHFYGRDAKFIPVCQMSKKIAELLGKKSLNESNLKILEQGGFGIRTTPLDVR